MRRTGLPVLFNIIKDGQIIGTEATKADSSITVTDVTEGMYAFVEVSAPAPYATLTEPVIAHVDQATINGGGTVTVTAADKKLPSLSILKRDAQTKEVIPGTVFEVKGIHYGYHNDVTTDADGTVSLRLAPGSYKITEKFVPAPYYLPSKNADREQTVSLNPGDEKTVTFKDHKAPELTIFKEDSVAGAPIEGGQVPRHLHQQRRGGGGSRLHRLRVYLHRCCVCVIVQCHGDVGMSHDIL